MEGATGGDEEDDDDSDLDEDLLAALDAELDFPGMAETVVEEVEAVDTSLPVD